MKNREKMRARNPLSATIMILVILSLMAFTFFLQGVDALSKRPTDQKFDYLRYTPSGTFQFDNPEAVNDSNFATFTTPLLSFNNSGTNQNLTRIRDMEFTGLEENVTNITYFLSYNATYTGSDWAIFDGIHIYNYSSASYYNFGSGNIAYQQGLGNFTFDNYIDGYRDVYDGNLSISTGGGGGRGGTMQVFGLGGAKFEIHWIENWIEYNIDNTPPNISEIRDTTETVTLTDGVVLNSSSPSRTYVFEVNNTEDFALGYCSYSLNGGANTTYSCSANVFSSASVPNIPTGSNTITFYVVSDAGGTASKTLNFEFFMFGWSENSQTYTAETWERSLEDFDINFTFDSVEYSITSAFFYYNGTAYLGSTTDTGDNRVYSASLNVPEVDTQTNFSFYWQFGVYNGSDTVSYDSLTYNQTVKNISVDNCSVFTNLVYNFTVKDEELRNILVGGTDNVTTNVDLRISAYGTTDEFLTYSKSFAFTNPATICLANPLNDTEYRVDLIVDYSATDYVQEFYFVDNGTLSNATIPQHIDLHDLLATDSTSFLVTFIDIDGLEVDEAIVHVDRFYVGEGVYREVERGKADDSGETHIHLVEEDVIYRFRITKDSQLLYTSTDYHAKCLSTPCEIELKATGDYFDYDDDEWDLFIGGSYSVTKDDSNRQISLSFTSDPTAFLNMNLTVYKYEDDGREIVASDVLNATSGTITLTIPQSYGNVSYVYAVYQDDELIVWGWFSLVQKGVDFFGNTLGLILTALMVLTLGLIAVVEGLPVIIFVFIGLILSMALNLIDLGWVALLSLIIAGGILIVKLNKRRGNR